MSKMVSSLAVLASVVLSGAAHAATIDVQVLNNRFQPNDVTIQVGDTVRWTNNSGVHDIRADDGSFSRGVGGGWTFTHTFTSAAEVLYHCSVHSQPGLPITAAMNGRVVVQPAGPTFAINQGIAGAWFNPATSGQGFLIDVLPGGSNPANNFIFLAWFTYEQQAQGKVGAPEHRWLTAQGPYTGAAATDIQVFRTAGGIFNNPQATTTTAVGTMTVSFTDCNTGSIQFNLPGNGLSGTIPIQRVIPGTQALCQMLSAPAPAQAAPAP